MSNETGIPLVATNDCHYLLKDDYEAQDILLCISIPSREPSVSANFCGRIKGVNYRFALKDAHVAHLEFPRETSIILRCAGKAGNPFQTTQGNRLSCRDQEGRRVLAVPQPNWVCPRSQRM